MIELKMPNGDEIWIESDPINGPRVTKITAPDGSYWHCSSGMETFPIRYKHWIDEKGNVFPTKEDWASAEGQ